MKKLICTTLFLLLFTMVGASSAQDVLFSWTHDDESNVAGYNFYVKEMPDGEFIQTWTGTEKAHMHVVTEVGITYVFAVTAYNALEESPHSNEIEYTLGEDVTIPLTPTAPKLIQMEF